jgi:hypothetical protein
MIDLPGWEKEAQRLLIQINFWDFSQSSRLRELFGRAAQDLERKLQADPQDPNLAALWAESMDISGHSLAGATGSFAPAPGRVWPSRVLLNRILEPLRRKQDWDGVLKLLAELAPQGPPDPVTPRAWDEYRRLQATILANQALTLASQGAWDQAGAVLEDARRWGGPEAVRMALLLRNGPWTGNRANQATWRLMVSEALSREGEGAPMPPVRPPLRLTVMGMPRWILEWTALNRHQDLAPWAPSELTWSVLAPAEHRQLQQRFAWGPGPRWALFRGEELLATGETCPTPQALAATLEGEGPSMLQRLNRFLALHPDHQGARRDRFQLLLRRMPDSRLEPLLAEDAGETGVVLNFTPQAPWKPDPERWGAAAMKVLPRIEEELRHWPERRSLWRAWIAWAPFHPARPSILTVVQGLPFWSPRADWRTELPLEVQRAVADDFRRQGAYMAMREWFRASWEAMDRRPRYDLRRGEREWVLDRRQDEEAAVVQPLRESLAVLGCTEELAEVDRAWREMTGKTPGRKP